MSKNPSPLLAFIEKLPLIGDYRRKEKRRDIDRRLREGLVQVLDRARRHLTDIQKEVLRTPGGLYWMDDIERLHSRLLLLIDEIRTTTDAYRPLFDIEEVGEAALEQLRQFDVTFAREALAMEERIRALREAIYGSSEEVRKVLEALFEHMTALVDTYEKREALLRHPEARLPSSKEDKNGISDTPVSEG